MTSAGCYPYSVKANAGGIIGSEILCFDTIASTNDYAKKNAASLADGAVIIARNQTVGRGRLGRRWESAKDSGIYMSVALKPHGINEFREKLFLYSFFSALAVRNAVSALYGIDCGIKWPNDVVCNGKKLCGILLESVLSGDEAYCVVTGIGINVNNEAFPPDLMEKATSVYMETGKKVDMTMLVHRLFTELNREYSRLLRGMSTEIMNDYRKLCVNTGRRVKLARNGETVMGTATDITINGELSVLLDCRECIYVVSGEAVIWDFY